MVAFCFFLRAPFSAVASTCFKGNFKRRLRAREVSAAVFTEASSSCAGGHPSPDAAAPGLAAYARLAPAAKKEDQRRAKAADTDIEVPDQSVHSNHGPCFTTNARCRPFRWAAPCSQNTSSRTCRAVIAKRVLLPSTPASHMQGRKAKASAGVATAAHGNARAPRSTPGKRGASRRPGLSTVRTGTAAWLQRLHPSGRCGQPPFASQELPTRLSATPARCQGYRPQHHVVAAHRRQGAGATEATEGPQTPAERAVSRLPGACPGHGNKAHPDPVGAQHVARGRDLCGGSPTSCQPTRPKTLQVHATGERSPSPPWRKASWDCRLAVFGRAPPSAPNSIAMCFSALQHRAPWQKDR